MQKLSFIVIQPHLEYGGAERQTVILVNRLVEMGHECHIILHDKKGGLVSELDDRVQLHSLGIENHLATPVVAIRLYRLLRRLPPSLVIVKLWSSILACVMVDRWVPKHAYNYCEDLDPSDHARYIRLGEVKQNLVRSIFRRRKFVTANTRMVAKSMVDQYGIALPHVIPSVVDVGLVQRLSSDGEKLRAGRPDVPQILTVGSLIERKGLLYLHAAMVKTGLELDWHIVGEGPLRAQLEDLALTSNTVNIHLYQGTSNPYGYMASADLLVHGALSEAFGIVIVEALAVGTPVVAAASIGPTEIQERLGDDSEFLRLFEPADEIDAARVIAERIHDLVSRPAGSEEYMKAYALESTAQLWIERNTALFAELQS